MLLQRGPSAKAVYKDMESENTGQETAGETVGTTSEFLVERAPEDREILEAAFQASL
jgi:hypothetical protein